MITVTLKPLETEKAISRKGWTRQQLANESGVSMATITQVLSGKQCRINTAIKIADSLEKEIEEIAVME